MIVGMTYAAFAAEPASPSSEAKGPVTVVVFGDSITASKEQPEAQRWPSLLQERLKAGDADRQIRVINAGVGGNTSREGLARIEKDVLAHKPDLVAIEFGGNDATDDTKRHVDLKEFEQNLAVIIAKVREVNPKAVVVMTTFPPIVDKRHSHGTRHGGLDKYIEQYRESVRRFAKDRKLVLFDLDAVIRPRAEELILGDGVHLTAEGNEIVARAMEPVIRETLGNLP
jgi:lysophospholipase L1-like esterase